MIISFRDGDTQTLAQGRRVKRFVAIEPSRVASCGNWKSPVGSTT